MEKMKTKNIFGLLVATITFAFIVLAVPSVSACHDGFACIEDVEVNSVVFDNQVTGAFGGDVVSVRVTFTANDDGMDGTAVEEDVRVMARILGEPGLSEITERFDVIEGSTYSRVLNIDLPFDIDPNERFVLEVSVESNSQEADTRQIDLEVQRSNFDVEILSVETEQEVKAGDNLAIDVVVKNRGRHEAEDTFVRASIPSLGISKRVFLGDLSAEDESDPDKFDSEEGRIFLRIPSDAVAGVYTVEVETFNDDSSTIVTRKIVINGAGDDSRVISSSTSKAFGTGDEKTYSVTIVNAGNSIKVYELILDSPDELDVELDEPIVAVPSGTSRTVKINVIALEEGKHNFSVNVFADGKLVKTENFVADVKGGKTAGARNTAVLLTVILAIIFVVLLIVLIVLLTRKPEKSEEFGESYY